jgi:hypothetical protein
LSKVKPVLDWRHEFCRHVPYSENVVNAQLKIGPTRSRVPTNGRATQESTSRTRTAVSYRIAGSIEKTRRKTYLGNGPYRRPGGPTEQTAVGRIQGRKALLFWPRMEDSKNGPPVHHKGSFCCGPWKGG